MILLTGATGRVGGNAALHLLRNEVPFRALLRDPGAAVELQDMGMHVVQGDLAQAASIASALTGVDRALLVTPNGEQQLQLERNFIEAAASAGVNHVVKVSSMEASATATAPIPRMHYEAECLVQSKLPCWTFLQPNFFMQNLLMYARAIAAHGAFNLPFGTAKAAPIDTRDVGEIAARVLSESGHSRKTYQLTGPSLMDFHQMAEHMSAVLGREIRYIDQPPAEFRAFMEKIIPSAWQVNAVCELFAQIADHALEHLADDAAELLGRPTRTLADFVQDHAAAFSA